MKVLYLSNGLPHYFNLVLSKINLTPEVELIVVVPSEKSQYIDAGVHETREGVSFRIVELKEYSIGRLYASFSGLPRLLLTERPDLVVLPEYMARGFQFRPVLWLLRKFLSFRLVLKSIPFRLPAYDDCLKPICGNEASGTDQPFSTGDRVHERMQALWQYVVLALRRQRFLMMDAHVTYVDEAREIYGSYGVPKDKVFVTRNSPDTDALRQIEHRIIEESGLPKRELCRLLHVGRLVPQKRVRLLLEAFEEVCQQFPQAELIIIGGGPDKEPLEALAVNLGLTKCVKFMGPIYDPIELAKQFLSAGIFVLPGLGGLSINEAMFYGLAVVCSEGDGTERFLVREAENGAYFRNGEKASLAAALSRLLSNPVKVAQMGKKSRDIIDREVNIETVVTGYLKAFKSVCALDR